MPVISVVSPVYNEGLCVDALCQRVGEALGRLTPDWEIVLVDDGSRDDSWAKIEAQHARDPRIRGVKFSRNFGHHVAITAGLDHCDGDWVVVMDSDLQDPPEFIATLHQKALEGYDVVLAQRRARKHGAVKRLLSRAFYSTYAYLSDTEYDPRVGVFRIMSRRVVEALRRMREVSRFFPGMVDWVGFPRAFVTVEHGARYAGDTKYPLRRQIALALDSLLSFSDKPLKFLVHFGLVISGLAFLFGAYVLALGATGHIVVSGYASLATAVVLMGGLTVVTVGVVGLYVGRIFRQVQGRPLYVVAEDTAADSLRPSRQNQYNTGGNV
jgi:dolichol-phosphate mannosyltransferase